ncbi:MAG: PCYCGC motif-containing (lipo)protein [archaeon]
MNKEKTIALVAVLLVVGGIAYFFLSTETAKAEIPAHVTGEVRGMYEWAKTPDGAALLEKIPCYCGCKFEGHLHSRHCFWRDNGDFDKHGTTCSVCLDIAKKAKQMSIEGKGVCEIRNEIDAFYAPNKDLATPTPMPAECLS